MISSLLRPNQSQRKKRRGSRSEPSYFQRDAPFQGGVFETRSFQHPDDRQRPSDSYHDEDEDAAASDEDGDGQDIEYDEITPLLPIFSAAHLDALPLYNITHSIRLLIIQRCETILTWEQLRSPQISQFLVKPIQQQIQDSHWSRATTYALIANCLQFSKEGQANPGSSGFCKTRAMLAEMLAMRLLREFSTRELIDVLSYDFDPLQGIPPPPTARGGGPSYKSALKFADYRPVSIRTSTIEVAIRAQAKRFLAHPLVVQHLEAVWAGNIVFHSAADNFHRFPTKQLDQQAVRQYGTTRSADMPRSQLIRRAVTLYDPADASVFKLSRLRVPRYRQLFSTLSYIIMLGLFLAVLIERSLEITVLEIIFWFWSTGFMLDELVGFSEQGFGLYLISVWNAFDVGILIMFFVYYVLRLYGIVIAASHKHHIADMAYDVLASTAVLLFPRLFNFLDHYRYFSQLLIAFRLMAQDLVALLILMAITCSGFFVAFTLSFGQQQFGGPAGTVYALFQIVMGFTPAAWAVWDQYNILGQSLLVIFMIICHFLVVTILITVLTNSFMAIVREANEEHQFLFAVNTISMVKSDALFSYIAPTNLIGWLFSPVRFVMPFRQFIKFNRTIIKVTHVPVLLLIYIYEKLRLARFQYEPDELIEQHGRKTALMPFALNGPPDLFSPGTRLREPSITAYHKDRALDEVFRRPFEGDATLTKQSTDQHSNVVDKWFHGIGNDGASEPEEQPRSILERLERARPVARRSATYGSSTRGRKKAWRSASQTGSAKSDPEDSYMRSIRRRPQPIREEDENAYVETHVTDRDADDELLTTADEEDEFNDLSTTTPPREVANEHVAEMHEEDMATPTEPQDDAQFPRELARVTKAQSHSENVKPKSDRGAQADTVRRIAHHRNSSTTTILFNPQSELSEASSASPRRIQRPMNESNRPRTTNRGDILNVPLSSTPRRANNLPATRARPGLPSRNGFQSTPNVARFLNLAARTDRRAPSFEAFALDLASDIGDNRNVVLNNDDAPFLSGSYQPGRAQEATRKQRRSDEESSQMSRIMLARMNTLEEGFKDMLREVKKLGSAAGSATASSRGTSANEAESSNMSALKKVPKKTGAGPSAKLHKSVASVQSLDVAGEAEKRKGSSLREVESVGDVATTTSDIAPTINSAEVAEEARPTNKTSNSF